jgi:hypothetical protein
MKVLILGRLATVLAFVASAALPVAAQRVATPLDPYEIAHPGFETTIPLFTLGLEFSWPRMLAMRREVFGLGLLQVLLTGVSSAVIGRWLGLEWLTAVVLGGTSLFGGRGLITGSLVGALIVGVFRNGLTLMGVSSVYQILITGMLVIVAVATDQWSRRAA